MNYDVVWMPIAEQELTELWMAAVDGAAITSAVHNLDQRLQRDPRSVGESRIGNVRVVFERPLAAFVEIVEDDRRVFVLNVWLA